MSHEKRHGPDCHAHFTDKFNAEAVRLVATNGRPFRVIAEDLGIGLSTLGKWVSATQEADLLSGPHEDTTKKLSHLRK